MIDLYDLLQKLRISSEWEKSGSYPHNEYYKLKKHNLEFVVIVNPGDRDCGSSAKLHIRVCEPITADYDKYIDDIDYSPLINKLNEYGINI